MAGVSYAVMGHTEAGGSITDGLKLRVVNGSLRQGAEQPFSLSRTLSASNTISVGASKRTWEFDAQVDYSPQSGYASTAQVIGWFRETTAANNAWKFQQPEDTTIYNVFVVNRASAGEWLTQSRTESTSMAVFHFSLVEQ